MKKWILFLLCILTVQIGYKITPVLAQGDKDALEIRKVVEVFLKALVSDDIDSAMQWVSINYSEIRGDNVIDYVKFKSGLEKYTDIVFYKRIDYSITDLQLDNLEIEDNKATVEIGWQWQGFNLVTREWDTGIAKRQVSLAKEKGIWKITRLRPLGQPEYRITPVLAQEDKDAQEIKKVVEAFLEDFTSDDLDSAMQRVSVNYSDRRGDNIIDYGKFKSELEERMDILFENHTNYSITNLQLDKLDIQDNKATVKIEYEWQGFNLVTQEWDTGIQRRRASLAKEKGIWKITQWRFLE